MELNKVKKEHFKKLNIICLPLGLVHPSYLANPALCQEGNPFCERTLIITL